jgi:tetratricopeptide (TPR) repeat protein
MVVPPRPPRPHAFDEVAAALEDGVRYERGGVVQRARVAFEEVAERWRENAGAAAEAWWRLANLHRLGSRWDQALDAARAGATLAREHGLPNVEADALNIEGAIWTSRGDYAAARALFQRTIELATSSSTRAGALQNLGAIEAEEGRFVQAEGLFDASREEYRSAGDARGEAVSLLNLGRLQMERGDPGLARETLDAAVGASRQTGDLEMHAAALLNLGIALGALGLHAQAEERITTAYGQFTIADIPVQRVRCLMQLAKVALARGETATARVCLLHARDVATALELGRELRLILAQLADVDRAV